MDYRYRDEGEFRVADRRHRGGGRDWDRGEWDPRGSGRPDWERRDWDRERSDYERRRRDEPGFMERLVDELRSWFRDEDARERDHRDAERRWGGGERGWGGRPEDTVDRDWARQWGYVDRGDRRERAGGERRAGDGGWIRDHGYVDEGYGREPRSGWGDPSGWGVEREFGYDRGRGAAGPHAGRGPRGYQRSDERIREDVCDALCAHGYIDASDIEVTVANGEVTLVGVVRERPEKRMAEDAAEQVSGVREVHNQLRVSPGGSGQDRETRPGDPRFRVA